MTTTPHKTRRTPIAVRRAYFIKLGRKGAWEEDSIRNSIMRISWKHQALKDILGQRWAKIRAQLEKESGNKGTATRDLHALQMIVRSTPADVWITFHKSKLWWARVDDTPIEQDAISKFRRMQGGWQCTDITGAPLMISDLPGTITRTQGFRATACEVKARDDLYRVLNGILSPAAQTIRDARAQLIKAVADGIPGLHWKDFETLGDLLFRESGWRRISMLGESMKFSDLELEDPLTGDRYQVQIKSACGLKEFKTYAADFDPARFRRLYFLVHTPDAPLRKHAAHKQGDQVELVLADRLAERVVDLGLVGWLMRRLR